MATYSFITYDVLKDVMYFTSTPTPGFKKTIETEGISTQQDREYIEGVKSTSNYSVTESASTYIISYLEGIPELDLNNSQTVNLRIEIDGDLDLNPSIGEVLIQSQNTDNTITTISVLNNSWPDPVIFNIKPIIKWPVLGKCKDCLKLDFLTGSNAYNFSGNIGGVWTGQYINGQKEYKVAIPDYSDVNNYGATTEYRIRWRPFASYTGTDYNGNSVSFSNQKRWVATPVSQINLPLTTESFFHVTSGPSASCPYYDATPTSSPWYNFLGKKGYFLVSLAPQLVDKPCPTFTPTPGPIDWGYNCNPNVGCVAAPSGSPGLYATLDECNLSCSVIDPNPVTSYRCLDGNCIEIEGPFGQFATLADCQASDCNNIPVEPPIIYECVEGNCYPITSGSVATGSFFNTLAECQASCSVPPPPTYEYLCTPNGCVQYPSGSLTGSFFTSIDECNAICNLPQPTTCSCDSTLNILSNSDFSQGSTNWEFYPNPFLPGTGGWNFSYIPNTAAGATGILFNSLNTSTVNILQSNVLNISCSYRVCFQAWTNNEGFDCGVSVGTGNFTTNLPPVTPPLTSIPTAYEFTISNVETTDLILYLGLFSLNNISSDNLGEIYIDNICLTRIGCPPPPEPAPEDCYITGSIYSYTSASYDCLCPEGYISNGSGSCIQSGSFLFNKQVTGTLVSSSLFILDPSVPIPSNLWGRYNAVLYYQYNSTTGLPTSSIGTGSVSSPENPSPYFGDSRVFNSAYTFDFLKQPFWKNNSTTFNYSPLLPGYSVQLIRKPISPYPTDWYGGGSFLNISSSKTYYVGLIADDIFRFTISGSSGTQIIAPPLFGPNGLNNSVYPQAFYGTNPYLPFTGSTFYSNISPGAPTGGNMSYSCLHIYPITLEAGCYYIKLEAKQLYGGSTGLGGVVFDMTAEELLNASSSYNLNVIWDSRTDLIYDFTNGITSSCPPGSTPLGPGPCDQCISSGSSLIPCGDCVDCTHGFLYNGYVVDKGGITLQGRGPGGIVNTDVINDTTWVVPTESDWNDLITFLNDGTAPTDVTITGSLGTIAGGKLKDYTRDLNATCWENPNIGAQTNASSSGWAGTAGGRRKNDGTFEGLGFEGLWWSANSLTTPPVTNGALMAARRLEHYSPDVYRDIFPKSYGCSIRLVRPAAANETNGTFIPDAYTGRDGKLYDGIVINNQVWITKNLSETLYNDGSSVSNTTTNINWSSTITTANPTSCYYDNNISNVDVTNGNINPATQECYTFPTYYVYEQCSGDIFLVQTVPGSTTTVGEVLRDSNEGCWSFFESSSGIPTYPHTFYTGNYFSGSNVIYDNCEECNAIHSIYMTFGTKNC